MRYFLECSHGYKEGTKQSISAQQPLTNGNMLMIRQLISVMSTKGIHSRRNLPAPLRSGVAGDHPRENMWALF